MKTFTAKTAWVTGASSGIGEEICKQLAQQGSILILSGRNIDRLNSVRNSLPNSSQHLVLPFDLETENSIDSLVQKAISHTGKIDFLFNNGGVSQRSEAHETTIEVVRKIMEINFFANIKLSQAILPHFQATKSGHLIITSSIAGKFGFYLRSSYSASKHALHGYYESLALEEAKNNIFVTLAIPGKINTPISKSALTKTGKSHGEMDHNQETGMPVSICVQKLLIAVERKKREVLIGNKETKAVWIKRFFPTLFWRIIKNQSPT
jgi:short-subunit dehydrogenase